VVSSLYHRVLKNGRTNYAIRTHNFKENGGFLQPPFNIKGCYFAAHSTVYFTTSGNNSGIYTM